MESRQLMKLVVVGCYKVGMAYSGAVCERQIIHK